MLAAYYQSLKIRRSDQATTMAAYQWNHPHRLEAIALSGTLSYTRDGRDFTSPGTSATRYLFALDFADANTYTRVWKANTPWDGIPSLDPGQVIISHQPSFPWAMIFIDAATDPAVIGTCTEYEYSRPTTSDPWTLDDTTTTDISLALGLFAFGGGEPDSGGQGDGSDDEKVEIQANLNFTGANNNLLPNLDTTSPHILRLPWEDSWASETTLFSDAFSDFITAENAADGGGHSGTCSLSLDFT